MTKRNTSSAADQLMAATQERVYAEELAPFNLAVSSIAQNEAERLAKVALREITPEEAQAIGAPVEPVVIGDALALRLRDTADRPNAINAAASVERMNLAREAGCLDLAHDLTETIAAENSLERMLAHQLAAAHVHAMRLTATAAEWLHGADPKVTHYERPRGTNAAYAVEASRLTNAAARMMSSFQEGMQTLHRIRAGGKQTVQVVHQHVQVNGNGQAVVAGNVTQKRRRGHKPNGGTV